MSIKSPSVIIIPEPCLQSWDEMNVVVNGKLCTHCNQVVVDFSQMTDAALLDYLKNNEWKCGQFKSSQLSRNIAAEVTTVKRFRLKCLAGIILLLGQAKVIDAQKQQTAITTTSPGQNNVAVSPADSTKPGMARSIINDRRSNQKRDMLVKGHFKGFIRQEKKKTFWQKLKFWQS